MQNKIKQAFVREITEIVRHAREAGFDSEQGSRMVNRPSGSFVLVGEYVNKYEQLIGKLIQKEKWGAKFSESFLENKLDDLIANAIASEDVKTICALFDELIADFESYNEERIVYIPLSGIRLIIDEFRIGQITLINMTDDLFNDILETNKRIIFSTPHTPEQKQRLIEINTANLSQLQGKVCSRFQLIAEPTRAKERTEEETRRAIDLFRYASPAIYRSDLRVAIGIDNEIPVRATRVSPMISTNRNNFVTNFDKTGSYQDFEINEQNIEMMTQIGVMEVSQILQKPLAEVTEFENMLLRGLHWLANSTIHSEKENAFLSVIICIETYLTPRENNPIGTAIAEGMALILANDLTNRKIIKKRIKDYYGKRSGISHGGDKIILEQDLKILIGMAGQLTMWMIEHRDQFNSAQALLQWIEDQKLS